MNNRKGFTLTELLTVIVIIGVLAGIAIPLITHFVKQGRQEYYDSLEKSLVVIAKNYFTDNPKELPRGQLDENGNAIYYKSLSLLEIKGNNYITNELVDKDGNECTESYVTVSNVEGEYIYEACLICAEENYSKDKVYCSFDPELVGGDKTLPVCEVSYNSYELGTWTSNNVILAITGTDNSGIDRIELATDPVENLELINSTASYEINTSTNNIYKFYVYDKAGNRGECNSETIMVDKQDPEVSITVVGGKNTATIQARLQDNLGVVAWQITTTFAEPTTDWIDIESAVDITKESVKTEAGTYYVWAKDIAGNINHEQVTLTLQSNSACTCALRKSCVNDSCPCQTYQSCNSCSCASWGSGTTYTDQTSCSASTTNTTKVTCTQYYRSAVYCRCFTMYSSSTTCKNSCSGSCESWGSRWFCTSGGSYGWKEGYTDCDAGCNQGANQDYPTKACPSSYPTDMGSYCRRYWYTKVVYSCSTYNRCSSCACETRSSCVNDNCACETYASCWLSD